jgi:CubicO group peptidase (beta-lactamase class C family)
MPYQQYITKNILEPLGMKDTQWEFSKVSPRLLVLGYRWEDEQFKEEPMLHDGAYGAMGGLITSIEDFAKYVALHLDAYPARNDADKNVVKRSSVREMHKPYMPRLFADAKDLQGNLCATMNGYAYGLGYRKDCKGIVRISHSGGLPGFGSEYRFYPDYGVGVICFANRTYAGAGVPNSRALDTLLAISGIKPRVLPASDILLKRKEQLVTLFKNWDEKLGQQILAENFYLDLSRDRWIKKAEEVFNRVGTIKSVGEVSGENQLRGGFDMIGDKGKVKVFFTLSPEYDPKIQQLDLTLE